MRLFIKKRITNETNIYIKICLCNSFKTIINTGIGFMDHMIHQFAFHGNFSVMISCKGDLHVDNHHTVEDIGIVLGKLFRLIFKKQKIQRFSNRCAILDEAYTHMVIDISGRPYLLFKTTVKQGYINGLDVNDINEFFRGFCNNAKISLHIKNYGKNIHHIIESIFKCFGLIINEVLLLSKQFVLSTK